MPATVEHQIAPSNVDPPKWKNILEEPGLMGELAIDAIMKAAPETPALKLLAKGVILEIKERLVVAMTAGRDRSELLWSATTLIMEMSRLGVFSDNETSLYTKAFETFKASR